MSVAFLYWFCIGLLATTYVVYPLIIKLLHRFFSVNNILFSKESQDLPSVSILMAAHNEAAVIEQKIESVFANNIILAERLHFWIGSDNSTDETNNIIARLEKKYPQIHFFSFFQRQGKPSIINQLAQKAIEKLGNHIFIITDANVIFTEVTIYEIIKHFKNNKVKVVESNIIGVGDAAPDIALTERKYVSGEVWHKYYESRIFKVFSGPMGGCYALRSEVYTPVPAHFLVDDFYITIAALAKKNAWGIVEPKAICYEGMSIGLDGEIRRKIRIGTGNFQNLFHFWKIWLSFPWRRISIVFVMHKLLRWIGPLLLLISAICLFWLAPKNNFYALLLLGNIFLMIMIPIMYQILEKFKINIMPIRLITYFFAANYALFRGLINFCRGGQTGIWEPTKRK